MTLPLFLVGFAALVVTLAVVVALISWHPSEHVVVHPPEIAASWTDWCEHTNPDGTSARCHAPATHELAAALTPHQDGGAAMVATYCVAHAPDGAVPIA